MLQNSPRGGSGGTWYVLCASGNAWERSWTIKVGPRAAQDGLRPLHASEKLPEKQGVTRLCADSRLARARLLSKMTQKRITLAGRGFEKRFQKRNRVPKNAEKALMSRYPSIYNTLASPTGVPKRTRGAQGRDRKSLPKTVQSWLPLGS